MVNLLITGAFSSLNKGDETRVKSSVRAIRRVIPNAHFGFYSSQPSVDKLIYDDLDVVIVPKYKAIYGLHYYDELSKLYYLLEILCLGIFWRISGKSLSKSIDNILEFDIFMDLSGESLGDYFGKKSLIFCLHPIILGLLLKKKVVLYAQSIGPFEDRFSRIFSKFILNNVNLITVRDKMSLDFLREYRIDKPHICLTADPAFLFKPANSENVKNILREHIDFESGKLLVGFSLGRGSFKKGMSNVKNVDDGYKHLVLSISDIIDYLVDRYNIDAIFIPHVVIPGENDIDVYKDIFNKLNHKDRFKLINGSHSCEELKGIIGYCDLFIGSRMHANIAALSMAVPTLAIAYSHKMPSLMEMLGQDDFVVDVLTINFKEMKIKIDSLYSLRMKVRADLNSNIELMRAKALTNAELLKNSIFF